MRIIRVLAFVVFLMLSSSSAYSGGRTALTYQGRLLNAGEPANGVFNVTFSLWDDQAAGSQIGSDIIFNSLPISNGLFTVELDYGANSFNNTDRWLEISINGVPLAPRQPITRAPYSIQTRGLFVDEDQNVGIGTSNPSWPLHVSTNALQAILGATDSNANSAVGVYGRVNDTSPGSFSAAVRGENLGIGGTGIGVWGSQEGSGWGVYGTSVNGRAVFGIASAESGLNFGVSGISFSTTGQGVSGLAGAASGINFGVVGQSNSPEGTGVYGLHNASTGTAPAVLGVTNSTSENATGVYGLVDSVTPGFLSAAVRGEINTGSSNGYGVWGSHDGFGNGVLGTTVNGHGGVRGVASAVSGLNSGVSGSSASDSGRGVYGFASHNSGVNSGVWGQSGSTNGRGVFGQAGHNVGVNYGVRGQTASLAGYAIYADGDYGGSGAKYFVQPHPYDASKEIRFVCLEGNESGTYFRGSTQLVDGRAYIDVPEVFKLVSEADGLTVQVTARGPATLWVESVELDRIVVAGNVDAVEFDYFVNGVRRGFADMQLVRENSAYVPELRGVPFGTQYRPAHRQILVENGILNPDFTPNEQTAAMMGWKLRDPEPDELSRAASNTTGEKK